mgnify:CR=1 FL=1
MRDFYEPSLLRRQLLWGLVGGLLAMTAVPLTVIWLNSLSVMPGDPLLVRASVLEATGWPWQVLLAVELALGFGFGVTVGLAVPPMEGSGHAVAVRTALHLLVSSALFAGLCWVCGLLWGSWQTWLTLLGMYWFAYAVVWLLRYLHWRSELRRIRERLGLEPASHPGVSRPGGGGGAGGAACVALAGAKQRHPSADGTAVSLCAAALFLPGYRMERRQTAGSGAALPGGLRFADGAPCVFAVSRERPVSGVGSCRLCPGRNPGGGVGETGKGACP